MPRSLIFPISAVALLLGLTACAAAPTSSSEDGTESLDLHADAIVLDVRTPEEYAAGHLDGARLIDFSAGEVAAAIPSLDPHAEYLVYCRSGNRSGQAIALMEQAGFTDLTNLGSLEQAASVTRLGIIG
ncbi:rhodanese-like domain-containing protein [Leucobacter weissii]|uniref:Rhodanese-like domain-containing protein n=1 Tax=Leucobacter weissii TaxID=1983706 RepID=A0A939ML29_9MICO|nr:rhodanese-like domain-containing protein [Leucobacter weissii]MBO1902958.1 rhodanese-like domain-containing protein [Leucobacter weissii]